MKKILLILTILLVFLVNVFSKDYPPEINKIVKTEDIVDGDTFKIKDKDFKQKIRLYAIDTPEIPYQKKKREKDIWGNKAKEELSLLLGEKQAHIKILKLASNGRYTALVTTGRTNIKIINEEMLKRGLVIVAEYYCKKEDLEKYLKLQTEASNNQAGFWADKDYYPEIEKMITNYQKKKQPAKK